MRFTPSSTARRSTRIASSRSRGSPHTPGPGNRMVPNPRRWTTRSPPRAKVPLAVAGRSLVVRMGVLHRQGLRSERRKAGPPRSNRLRTPAGPAGGHALAHPAEDVAALQHPPLARRDAAEHIELEGAGEVVAQGPAVVP